MAIRRPEDSVLHFHLFCLLFLFNMCHLGFCSSLFDSKERPCSYIKDAYGIVTMADCSSRNLQEVPIDIPATVEILSLSNNNIEVLPNYVFKNLSNLKELDLSTNKVRLLMDNCFSGLSNLATLRLNSNNLPYTETTYPSYVFQDMINLEYLDIHGNNALQQGDTIYPATALSKLKSLRNLAMDGLNQELGAGFQSLRQLEVLNISGYENFCQMVQLTDSTFENLENISLTTLDIGACGITHISQSAFKHLAHLESLTLTGNANLGFEGVANITHSLFYTKILELNLESVHHYGDPVRLKGNIFSNLNLTNLTSLKLDNNYIDRIDEKFAYFLPISLKYLSLHNNDISDARFLGNLHILKNLETFDISWQLQYHSVSKNMSTVNPMLSHQPDTIMLPPNVQNIIANNLKIGFLLTPNLQFSTNRVKYVDLSSNSLTLWIGKWYGLHHLEFLNLSNVNIFQIGTTAFGDMPSLKTLLLCCNHFGQTIMQDKQYLTFSNQTHLEILDLSNDEIKDLPEYLLANLKSLKILDLHGNALTTIRFHLYSLINLEILDLSNNQLSKLSHQNMDEIDHILAQRPYKNLSINLMENTLKCTCEEQEFLNWVKMQMSASTLSFTNWNNYTCVSDNDDVLALEHLDDIISELWIHCIASSVILYCSIGFVVMILILTSLAVIYYKRWKIKYLYCIKRRHILPYQPLKGDENEIFDAYFSHSDSSNEIVQQLEGGLEQKGFGLFLPSVELGGRLEINGTAIAIQNSNCVIALLTKDYVNDPMKVFEFNMAAIDGLYGKQQKVIPVLLEHDIPLKDYEREMLQYLNANPPYIFQNANELLNYLELKIAALSKGM